jgi:beta-lactamase class A
LRESTDARSSVIYIFSAIRPAHRSLDRGAFAPHHLSLQEGRSNVITRRLFTSGLGAAGAGLGAKASLAAPFSAREFQATIAEIESRSGGRLGVAFLDTGTGERFGYREDESFPMCSTFKVLASGAVLAQVDAGQAQLQQRIRFEESDLVEYSPITKAHAGRDGMTLSELCAAALDYSDNTAANMLLRQIGGPAALTRFARSLGDPVTRLDRIETELNEALPGDPRDTTTPAAMLADLEKLALGAALSNASRDQLTAWLRANTTGETRIRAGLPAGWSVGDKTGSGDRGTTNDVAVIWPPHRKPAVVTAFLTATSAPVDVRNEALASVGRLSAKLLAVR